MPGSRWSGQTLHHTDQRFCQLDDRYHQRGIIPSLALQKQRTRRRIAMMKKEKKWVKENMSWPQYEEEEKEKEKISQVERVESSSSSTKKQVRKETKSQKSEKNSFNFSRPNSNPLGRRIEPESRNNLSTLLYFVFVFFFFFSFFLTTSISSICIISLSSFALWWEEKCDLPITVNVIT